MKETYKFYKEIKTGKIFPVENEKEIDKDNFIELKANTTDGAKEKHIPVYEKKQNQILVTIGSIEHPMTEEHYIKWIAMATERGIKIIDLNPQMPPKVTFEYQENSIIYAYCNLHGLWKKMIE